MTSLTELRKAMQGADVPVVLFSWMAEVERQLSELREDDAEFRNDLADALINRGTLG